MSHTSDPTRRNFIAAGSATLAALALRAHAAVLQPPAKSSADSNNPGPENTHLDGANSNGLNPPPTDHGETESFWNSFSIQHRRIQEGGWSRQVTVHDFPLAKEIAGVNMRLTNGGVRELHWHNAGEWALMLDGNARITAIDNDGKAFVDDVTAGDLWFFPTGIPHSIQGLEPNGAEFLLVFDDGKFSEADTTLISDYLRHTPNEVLAKNLGLTEADIAPIYEQTPPDGRYIFQASKAIPLEEDRKLVAGSLGLSPQQFSFHLASMKPTYQTKSGEVRIVDSKNFPASTTIAAAHIIVKPGGLRELHWHQNADEWSYFIQGKGRMTLFFNGAKARTADFNASDVGYVPRTLGHYIENIGDTDLIFLEMFKAPQFQDLSLNQWLTRIPPSLLKDHLNIPKSLLAHLPDTKATVLPI